WDMVAAQKRREIQVGLLGGLARQDFQQISAPDQILQAAYTEHGQPFARFLGNEGEEIHHHVRSADEMVLAQLIILRGYAGGAVVQVADAQVLAAQGDHRRGTEAEALGAQDRRLEDRKSTRLNSSHVKISYA